ncbi:MAG: glutathione S-transferase [Oceanicoccus sp.]|jgi:glutathione S-transferase
MNEPGSALILYGVPFSQPVRAVMWLLLMKRLPFRMILINPGSSGTTGSRNPSFLAKNPAGTIPCIEEPDSGFTLGEAHAILTYLARKHGWQDVYPNDYQTRAKIDWYLHYHHRNVRDASLGLVAPKIRKDLDIPEAMQAASKKTFTAALKTLEYDCLANNRYIASDNVTLADIAAYVEIGQLQPKFTNVYDLSAFPNVQRWLVDMAEVDSHDDVHVVLTELGDIRNEAPSMDTIKRANKLALSRLNERLVTMV